MIAALSVWWNLLWLLAIPAMLLWIWVRRDPSRPWGTFVSISEFETKDDVDKYRTHKHKIMTVSHLKRYPSCETYQATYIKSTKLGHGTYWHRQSDGQRMDSEFDAMLDSMYNCNKISDIETEILSR